MPVKSDPTPLISVVICTHNRADLLHFPLESLASQEVEETLFEVVVVDNASRDETAAVVGSYREADPRARYVREEAVGLSHARNCGWREARGEYVAYTDDDCRLPPDWLARARKIVEEHSPGCFGGPFFPFYDGPKPDWFKDSYGSRERARAAGPLPEGKNLLGGNLFIRRDLLERSGGFDPAFGMSGSDIGYGEEEELQERLRRLDPPMIPYYDPELPVFHLVRRDKMSVVWGLRAAFAKGRDATGVFADAAGGDHGRLRWAGQGLRALGGLVLDLLRALVLRDRTAYPRIENYLYEETTRRLRRLGSVYARLRASG